MSTVAVPAGLSEGERVEAMAARTLHWFVLAAIAYRALATLSTATQSISVAESVTDKYILAVAVIVIADLALLAGVASGRFRWLLRSNAFYAADLLVAVTLSLWATSILPRGTFLLPGRDVFSFYAVGTVALWTTLRGARTGSVLVVGDALLHIVMARLNDSIFDFAGRTQYLARLAWFFLVLAVTLVMMVLARRGARVAVAEGVRAGQLAERADALRALHDTVLQTLARIAQLAAGGAWSAAEGLREVREIALRQAGELRTALDHEDIRVPGGLIGGLEALAAEFKERGLQVELVTAEFHADPPALVTQTMVGAAREALTNVTKHASVNDAVVRAASSAEGVEVVVLDQGRGFDPHDPTDGYGLRYSIRQRMAAVGGSAQVWSAPGRGTRVRLTLPGPHDFESGDTTGTGSSRLIDTGRLSYVGNARCGSRSFGSGFTDLQGPEATLNWFALVPLTFRTAVLPVLAIAAVANLGRDAPRVASVLVGPVLAANLALLGGIASGRFYRLLRSNAFFAADLLVAVGLHLWVAFTLSPKTFLTPGPDVMWAYAFGTLALWTVLRGAGAGVVMLGGGFMLELAGAQINGMGIRSEDWAFFLSHFLMLGSALILALLIMGLARRGAGMAVAEGERAGREAERADALRALHDPVLQTLARLAQLASASEAGRAADERLQEVRGIALRQTGDLRATLDQEDARARGGLAEQLEMLATEFRGLGLRVELVTAELDVDPPAPVTQALVGAAREALANVTKHAAVPHAVVRAANSAEGVEVVVRDQGLGFESTALTTGQESSHSIRQRMAAVGGDAEVWSAPGRGTRVRLRWRPR
ncbi:MAG: sensor histidine kinase [Egibacteraceae bacterium]